MPFGKTDMSWLMERIMGLYFLFWCLEVVFVIWMLVDLLTSKAETTTKILWALIIILLPLLGSLLYFLIQRPKRNG